MHAARVILAYAVLGPLIGATVVFLGISATDPGLARENWGGLAAFVFLFAWPFGLPQALAAGVAHVLAVRRLDPGKAVLVCISATAGAATAIVFVILLGNYEKTFASAGGVFRLLLPPIVSATAIALLLERGRRRA